MLTCRNKNETMLSKTACSPTSSIMLIRHVEEGCEENADIVKEDHVDILHVEVTTRPMAQKDVCVVKCAHVV